ncbi:hypothetical protein ARMGADRAFT_1080955 [Armillaria gallica]|uniref:Uncharacterized protein n=1 Tax=Armillaria gallica TaxID=47427 RepID=A0A2H3DDI0_ARMGA|nr:hypothetical protein ARMGADRAFT_1080955 [Armillaria gallica]
MSYEVDQFDSEHEEKPKKRNRDSEGGASARKLKTSTTGDAKKALLKSKKGGKKKENVESEDDGEADEDVGTSKKGTSPPPAKKAKRDKQEHGEGNVSNDLETLKVCEWRHRLQKTILSNKGDLRRRICPRWIKCSVQSRHTSLSPFTR